MDLNIKVIGSDIHTIVYDKRDDFGFPIVNFPWLIGDVPRLPSHGIYILQLVRFARCYTSVVISILIISKLLQNCLHRVIDITSFEKLLESSLYHTQNFYRNLVVFRSKNMYLKESLTGSHRVFYGDLVYKLRRVKDTPNSISSGSKIVKRLQRRQYDPLIIERTIGLVFGPCTAS